MSAGALRFAAVPVGPGGLAGCASCGPRVAGAYDDAETIEARVRRAVQCWDTPPGPNLLLTGPEPFEHPALPRLVASCAAAGAQRIGIRTDGRALLAGDNAPGVLGAGVHHLHVRLFAADRGLGDRLAGAPGSVAAARDGVGAYRSAAATSGTPVVVTAVVPVCRHTLGMLSETVAALAEWDVQAVRLEAAGPLASSAAAALAAACDTGMVNRLWVEVDTALPLPGSHTLHALERGWPDV